MPVLVAPPRRRRSQLGRDKRGPSRGGSPHRVKRPEGRDKRGPSRGGGRGATALPVGVLPRTRGRSPYTAKWLFSARYFINCASSAKSAREV